MEKHGKLDILLRLDTSTLTTTRYLPFPLYKSYIQIVL